jgi:hypothetical protein
VLCWGRNDEGQCGVGDLFGDYSREKKQEDAEHEALLAQQKTEGIAPEEKTKGKAKKEKQPDLNKIRYFRRPNEVTGLKDMKITRIFAGTHYNYAYDG